jgi:uncharacterized protein YjgD (DUF1641 family)
MDSLWHTVVTNNGKNSADLLQTQFAAINEKLDKITARLDAMDSARHGTEELRTDLLNVGKEVYKVAVREMEDVASFDINDAVALLKQLMHSAPTLKAWLTRLEQADELLNDATPVVKGAYDKTIEFLSEAERRGYFAFAREAVCIADTIVTSFTIEDVHLLRENIVTILTTVKDLTQPDMLTSVENALGFFRKMNIDVETDVSYMKLLRTFRDPDTRRGILYLLEFAKSLSHPNGVANQNVNQTRS